MSESELLYDWWFTASQFILAISPVRLTTSNFIFQLSTCSYSPYVTSSCRSKSHGTHDHILLSWIQDSPNWRASRQTPQKTLPRTAVLLLCVHIHCQGEMFIEPFPSNSGLFRLLESSSRCLSLFHSSGFEPSCHNMNLHCCENLTSQIYYCTEWFKRHTSDIYIY
jgi:hypothetical protein